MTKVKPDEQLPLIAQEALGGSRLMDVFLKDGFALAFSPESIKISVPEVKSYAGDLAAKLVSDRFIEDVTGLNELTQTIAHSDPALQRAVYSNPSNRFDFARMQKRLRSHQGWNRLVKASVANVTGDDDLVNPVCQAIVSIEGGREELAKAAFARLWK